MAKTFRTWFRQQLSDRGLSRHAVALMLGMSDETVQALAQGDEEPTANQVRAVAAAFDMDPASVPGYTPATAEED